MKRIDELIETCCEATCPVCGSDMDMVRPGKWQCQKCELDGMLSEAHKKGWEQAKAEARVEINRRDELCKKCEREYEAELARYKQGVEVDGLVAYENYPWPIRILDTALEKFHHECVRVLVMKVEEE